MTFLDTSTQQEILSRGTVTPEQLEEAMTAALNGPEQRGLRIGHRRWNIKPVAITRDGNKITVIGTRGHHISRRRKGLPNDRYYYTIEKEGSEIKNIDVEFRHGLVRLAKVIIQIAQEAWKIYKDAKDKGKSDMAASQDAFRETQKLLDGSSRGIASFLIVNIALRAK